MKRNVASQFVALGLAVTGAVAFLAAGNPGLAAEPPSPSGERTVLQAYQQLLSAKRFAFGGIGFAGTISQEEKAFHAVAASPNAVELFTALLKNGSGEAQLYGLCGIRKSAPRSFDAQSRPVLSANLKINTTSGCVVSEENASDVVARIAAGSYDLQISNVRIR